MNDSLLLRLPETKAYRPSSITEFYGAAVIASKYCGMRNTPRILNRYWQHGWVPKSKQLSPDFVATETINNKNALILVARKDEEEYLIKNGYRAKAIGLPFCYITSQGHSRIQNSLLVMPAHATRHIPINFREEYKQFIKYVLEQSRYFDTVYVCMHQEDFDLGYSKIWENAGFKVIRGAAIDDANALVRIHALLSQFETVLSDALGSHIVYAASLGAKISLIESRGWEYDVSKDPFFKPDLVKLNNDINKLEINPKTSPYSFLFDEPQVAKQHIEWGLEQIGACNMVSPSELKHILGWNLSNRLVDSSKVLVRKVKALPKKVLSLKLF